MSHKKHVSEGGGLKIRKQLALELRYFLNIIFRIFTQIIMMSEDFHRFFDRTTRLVERALYEDINVFVDYTGGGGGAGEDGNGTGWEDKVWWGSWKGGDCSCRPFCVKSMLLF